VSACPLFIETIFGALSSLMSVIILLTLVSLSIALFFLGAFIWNIRKGQYDDEEGDSIRILFDQPKDDTPSPHS
jgi:cbb3-type cytochrome oxidase maturation protein